LIGDKKSFAVGHKFFSKTERISYITDQYLGVGKCVTIIDTPGTKDTDGVCKPELPNLVTNLAKRCGNT
jgi:hypothetical protein